MERPLRTNSSQPPRPRPRPRPRPDGAPQGSRSPRPQGDPSRRMLSDEQAARQAAKREAMREERRRKKRRKRIIMTVLLSVLAVVLIIAASFTGLLIYLQGLTGEYDDIAACVQQPPMDYASRYSFSAVDNTMLMKLDKNDIWWLLYQSGAISRMEQLDAKLSSAGMRLTGMGISTAGSALTVDVEIAVVGNIRLPMKAYCDIDHSGEDIVISVSQLKLGNGWSAPLNWLCKRCNSDPESLYLTISKSIHPILSDIRSIQLSNGSLVAALGLEGYIYSEALSNPEGVLELNRMGVENDALGVVLEHGISTAALDEVFTNFQLLPNSYVTFRASALALADSAQFTEYFSGANAVYLQRFMPELTLEAVGEAHYDMYGTATGRTQLIEALATSLNAAYIRGTVAEPAPPQPAAAEEDGEEDSEEPVDPATILMPQPAANFVNYAINGSPELAMEQIAGNSWPEYSSWISEEDMRAVYLASFPDSSVERPAPQQPATEEDDEDDEDEEAAPPQPATITTPEKPLGLMVRLPDGSFRIYYHTAALNGTQVEFTLAPAVEISEVEGAAYLAAELIPTVPYPGGTVIAPPAELEIPVAPPEEEQTA